MRELRLVPAALLAWLVVGTTLATRQPWIGLILVLGAACFALKWRGPGITAAALSGTTLLVAYLRVRAAPEKYPARIQATIASIPTKTKTGGWLVPLDTGPVTVKAFSRQEPPATGATIWADVVSKPNDHPEVSPVLLTIGRLGEIDPAHGLTAWSTQLKEYFRGTCERWLGPATEGLVPGMVLGDTSDQTQAQKDMFLDTGLTHLTAVSGSNITILTVAAVLAAKAATLGPRVQVACAAATLAAFVTIVGGEPSVLRASVMGIVGLLAVVGSAQVEPAHGLALAVIALLLVDSNLATSYGFALSVAATAGLVALSPLIYRALARHRWASRSPDVVLRATAVAIAADLVTMPLVAAMSGRVLLASVPANILVAPAVAPVTVLGLLGLVIPPAVKLTEPFAWWITLVARTLSDAPTLDIPVALAMLLAGWLVWLIHIKQAHWLLLGLLYFVPRPGPEPVKLEKVVQLESIPKNYTPPAGIQAVIVWEDGPPNSRPQRTKEGVPILYPNRDGPVRVYPDGSQRAQRSHF